MNFLKVLRFVFYVEAPGPLQVACRVGSGRTAPAYLLTGLSVLSALTHPGVLARASP